MKTLCVDIGGTGIKTLVLDPSGSPLGDRQRLKTPHPAVPETVLSVIEELARLSGEFDRVSVGFPGVVADGVTRTAPNLDDGWAEFPFAEEIGRRLGKPARVMNDADIQGLSVIEGRGVEMLITLGTGMGSALYLDGRCMPNLELGHHPFRKKRSYEERISNEQRERVGNKRWNRRVREVIEQLGPIFNYRRLYVGGGNARYLAREGLAENVLVVDNVAGLLGGIRLWA